MTKLQVFFLIFLVLGMFLFLFSTSDSNNIDMLAYVSAGLIVVGLIGNLILSFINLKKMRKLNEEADEELKRTINEINNKK